MINNDFSVQRGYQHLLEAKRGTRSQEEIISDLESELNNVDEIDLLLYAMRLIIELDFRKTSELYCNLESPMKQAFYLLDVYYSLKERGASEKLTKMKIEKISHLLGEMEVAYFASLAFPNKGDVFHDERDEKLDVALSTFLTYFSNAKLCFEEQTLDRIKRFLKPYDSWINTKYGFYVDDAIKFILHIRHLNNSKYSEITHKGLKYTYYSSHPEEWRKLTEDFERRGLEPSEWGSQPELEGIFDMLRTNPGEICLHSREEVEDIDLKEEVKQKLIDFFTYDKSEVEKCDTIYYADFHFSEKRPLFRVGDQYVCPINKFLLEALYNRLYTDLHVNVKFKQQIDRAFERKICEIFTSFFPEKTKIFTNYSVDGCSENDLLIGCGTTWLVVEIKNTGFRPPLRDPLRAFEKIKSDFDKAIQLGYNQCKRVENILLTGSDVDVLDAATKKLLYKIKAKNITNVWSIVVTDYKYGPIQTDLSNLLELEDGLFPWSICADDLETLFLLMKKLLKGSAATRFLEFLDYREQYHGHVMCFDELELGGWYLCNREQFKKYAASESIVGTIPAMGEIFDAYYVIGLGFTNELDMEAKQHYLLPDYPTNFEMDDIRNLLGST